MADKFLDLSKDAFESSSAYIDGNWKADWEYSLRAFRSEHAPGSKYLSEEYKSRSRLFSPKTRSIIRKNEAAAFQAAFSNREVVNVEPGNPDDLMSVASAAALKEVMEYRLSRTISTFELYLGGVQDAQTTGTVCSYQYWDYKKKGDRKIVDKPCIDLVPIENIRLDGGASWLDPVNTSPYFCHIIPMYVCDVRGLMNSEDEKTGTKFKKFDDSIIAKAKPEDIDRVRQARLGNKEDPHNEDHPIKAFDIVWVMRWCMKDSQGEDHCYYTLGTENLLTDPKPIEEVYFHGVRPYVIGCSILETHKALKSGLPMLVKPIQQETNDVRNQRLDNVKFVLNKRWLVARGRQTDVQSLVRNVPGGVTLTTDPNTDVKESNWPDVTSSSFVEHDRLNSEFDDLAGNFSPSTKVANNAVNDTLGGSKLASQGAGLMTEYLLQTINQTWWQKVLRQLALLEQYYETDEIVLSVCAQKAQLFPRFGISRITDDMLLSESTVTVNMAMGDPSQRLQKFLVTTNAAMQFIGQAPPGFNVKEGIKELYANAGYRDGARFWTEQQDPRLLKAMQALQQMKGMLEGKQMELQAGMQETQLKLTSNERIKAAELQIDEGRIQGDLAIRQAEIVVEQQRIKLEELKLQMEMEGMAEEHRMKMTEMGAKMQEAHIKLEQEQHKLAGQAVKIASEIEKAQLELQTARTGNENESKIGQVAQSVTQSMSSVAEQIQSIQSALQSNQGEVQRLGQGLGAVMGMVSMPKKKPKGFSLKKPDGKKTAAVVVDYDDGTTEELTVGS